VRQNPQWHEQKLLQSEQIIISTLTIGGKIGIISLPEDLGNRVGCRRTDSTVPGEVISGATFVAEGIGSS